jgi:hypothetical protein
MHRMYTVFDYGAGHVAAAGAGPRVGFGELTAAEKAAAQAAFDRGLASSSGTRSSWTGWPLLLVLLGSAVLTIGL